MAVRRALSLRGIFPPLVTPFTADTLVTPFTADTLAVDHAALRHNLHKLLDSPGGVHGYVALGSNAETPLLDVDEKVAIVETIVQFKDEHHPGAKVIAGAGVESTAHTIDLCKRLASVGAHYMLVITPSFYKTAMTHAALVNHYTRVADASPVPVLLYSVPGNTTIDLPAETAIRLAEHDNIITKIARIVAETKSNNFQVLAGSAGFLLPALQAGCVGGVCALANVLPAQMTSLYDEFAANGWSPTLQQRQTDVIQANAIVTRGLGVAGLKHIMNEFGYNAGVPRPPLVPLLDAQKAQVDTIFKAFK